MENNNKLRRIEWVELNLPGLREFDRFLGWAIGRAAFSIWLFSLDVIRTTCRLGIALVDRTEKATNHLLDVYTQMPHQGLASSQYMDVVAVTVEQPQEIITDIVEAISSKQVMIIGNSGSGKSTVAQYLAYTVGGRVRVLECEGTPEDWKGLEVIGRGEDWESINAAMELELEELSKRVKIRNEKGDAFVAALGGEVTIVEEYPEVRINCPSADQWFDRHARRGRKTQRFIICLSQFDRVGAWGLEGKGDLGECFYRIRLGKMAIAHAKSLKNEQLINWLKQDQSHCLLDDYPCKLPSYREMRAIATRPYSYNAIEPQKDAEKSLKPAQDKDFSDSFSEENRILWRMIQRFGSGKSDSAIVTEVMGFTGNRYGEGKDLLERLRREHGS